jgi:cytochrome c oxidase cbb3-type subunit 3
MTNEAPKKELGHGHSDFDGIEEEDNPMPRWWVRLFQLSVVFAVGYMAWYHLPWFPAVSQLEEFQQGLAELKGGPLANEGGADLAKESPSVSLLERAKDAARVERGRALYATNCASCHAADGGGLIGPNLADDAWIHGRTAAALEKVLSEGVPAKGMPGWGAILGQARIGDLTAFVASLQGSRPASPKPPQGEKGALQ